MPLLSSKLSHTRETFLPLANPLRLLSNHNGIWSTWLSLMCMGKGLFENRGVKGNRAAINPI
jgi:hypothetical protein